MRRSTLAPAAFLYAGFAVLALLALPHLDGPLEAFGAPHAGGVFMGRNPAEGLLWGVGLGGILTTTSLGASRFTPWGRRLNRLLARLFGGLHPVDALMLAALSSFAEELVFRGILLPYLGLLLSSALFGVAHLVPRNGLWPWSVWAAGAGLALGWSANATGGILAPTLAHFAVNAVGLLQLAGQKR